MPNFSAAYVIDEVLEFLEEKGKHALIQRLNRFASFELTGVESELDFRRSHPVLAVADAFMARGVPTRCPVDVASMLLEQVAGVLIPTHRRNHKLCFDLPEGLRNVLEAQLDSLGGASSFFEKEFQRELGVLLGCPLGVARIQKALLYLIHEGVLRLQDSTWRILIIERDFPCAYLALQDFNKFLSLLFSVLGTEEQLPTIQMKVIQAEGAQNEQLNGITPFEWMSTHEASLHMSFDVILDVAVLNVVPGVDSYERPDTPYICLRPTAEPATNRVSDYLPRISKLWHTPASDFEDDPVVYLCRYLVQNAFRVDLPERQIRDLAQGILGIKNGLLWNANPFLRKLAWIIRGIIQPGLSISICAENVQVLQIALFLESHKMGDAFWIPEHSSSTYAGNLKKGLEQRRPIFVLLTANYLQKISQSLSEGFEVYSPISAVFIHQIQHYSLWSPGFQIQYIGLPDILHQVFRGVPCLGLPDFLSYDLIREVSQAFGWEEKNKYLSQESSFHRDHLTYKIVPITFRQSSFLIKNPDKGAVMVKFPVIKRIIKNIPFELALPKRDGTLPPIKGLLYQPRTRLSQQDSLDTLEKYLASEPDVRPVIFDPPVQIPGGNCNFSDLEALVSFNVEGNLLLSSGFSHYLAGMEQVRYSIHYHSPLGLEQFWMETDLGSGTSEVYKSYILYSPEDETQIDQYHSLQFPEPIFSDNGYRMYREYHVLQEFWEEITYPENFVLDLLKQQVAQYPVEGLSISQEEGEGLALVLKKADGTGSAGGERVIGTIKVNEGALEVWDSEFSLGLEILEDLKRCLFSFHNREPIWDLAQDFSSKGLDDILAENEIGTSVHVVLGFENNGLNLLTDLLKTEGNFELTIEWIRNAFHQSPGFEQFWAYLSESSHVNISSDQAYETIRTLYYRIRTRKFTLRAIQALKIVGLIDTFTLSENMGVCFLTLSPKPENSYKENFENFLRTHLRPTDVGEWREWIATQEEGSLLKTCVNGVIRFIYEYVEPQFITKAKHSLYAMDAGVHNGSKAVETYVQNYFWAAYALPGFLPKDIVEEPDDMALFKKYIRYLLHPPQDLQIGSVWANVRHLAQACEVLNQEPNRPALMALSALANLLEAAWAGEEILQDHNQFVKLYQSLEGMLGDNTQQEWPQILYSLQEVGVALDPELGKALATLTEVFMVRYYGLWLKNFNARFIDVNVSH